MIIVTRGAGGGGFWRRVLREELFSGTQGRRHSYTGKERAELGRVHGKENSGGFESETTDSGIKPHIRKRRRFCATTARDNSISRLLIERNLWVRGAWDRMLFASRTAE